MKDNFEQGGCSGKCFGIGLVYSNYVHGILDISGF